MFTFLIFLIHRSQFLRENNLLVSRPQLLDPDVDMTSPPAVSKQSNRNLDLLLNPTDKIPLILIADGVFLLALGLVIIVFHLHEKSEDEKERETVQAFNYF